MRITKAIAENVAKELTKKLDGKIKEHQADLRAVVTDIAKSSIPKDVLACYKKHPSYFNDRQKVSLCGNGLHYDEVPLLDKLPIDYYYKPNEKDSASILARLNNISKLKKEAEELENDIYVALVALKTYKRVEQEFPEAVQYLPESSQCVAIAIPMKDLRGKINNL